MLPSRVFVVAAFFSALVGIELTSGIAEDQALLSVKSASVGFGGRFKSGFWQPVRLTVVAGPQGARGRLEVVARDGDQVPVIYVAEGKGNIDLAAGDETTILLYAKSGPVETAMTVRLTSGDEVLWSGNISGLISPPLASTQELVVGVGPPVGLSEAVALIRRRPEVALRSAVVESAAELPDRWWGYDGVDALLLTTSSADFLAALTSQQQRAIVEWVLYGGRLILSVGSRGEQMLAADSPWLPLIPGELNEVDALRERSGLEALTKTELPFDEEFFQRNRPRVTRLRNTRGEVLLDEISGSTTRPLALHAPAGLGEIVFIGLDLDHPALEKWKGRPRLVAALLDRDRSQRERIEHEARGSVTHLGYDDLIGQLGAALDQFPGVTLVNFTTVSLIMVAYLLLIGPGDFLLLARLGWRRERTWITFPLVAVSVMALAWFLGREMHGSRVQANLAEIVDIDLARRLVRGTVWAHLYSPFTEHYDAQLKFAAPGVIEQPPQGLLAWQGLPGDSLGGLESRQVALAQSQPYRALLDTSQPTLADLTLRMASSKRLACTWWAPSALDSQTDLTTDQFGLLAGSFRFPLPVQLEDCILAHGEKLYRLRTLTPGQTVRMAELDPLNLEARLTERRVEQSKDVTTRWEQDSVDIPRIMQMVMFHEAARGRSYTGLTHRYQPRTDLSEHVRLGQAILVGRAKEPVARLLDRSDRPLADANDTDTSTWYRIILPVSAPAPNQP